MCMLLQMHRVNMPVMLMFVIPLTMLADLLESGLCGKVCAPRMAGRTDLKCPGGYGLA